MGKTFKILIVMLMVITTGKASFDLIVAQDGSGNFTHISDALAAAPNNSLQRFSIQIKNGVYQEYIQVPREKTNIALIGEGMDSTVIVGNRSNHSGWGTSQSATVGIHGQGFTAQDITFRNSAGAAMGQAVAVEDGANHSAFYRCRFDGYQDTFFVADGIQFYRDCEVYGTVDFIFGDATVVFQNCVIYAHKPVIGQATTVTAQSRTSELENSGIVLHNCTITQANDFNSSAGAKVFLGRPWRNYSRTIVMQSYLPDIVDPEGWLQWGDETFKNDLVFYAEYENRGPGANTTGRVKWKGYHILTNQAEAENYTVRNFIKGEEWLPSTGFPFNLDLLDFSDFA